MKNDRSVKPFQMMALTIPAVEAAVGKNWLPTLVIALAACLLCSWMSIQEDPDWKWLSKLRIVALIFLLSWGLGWTHLCWPGRGASYAVPGFLLVLALYGICKDSGIIASSVLRYGMYFILMMIGILGVTQLKAEGLRPLAQLPDMKLAVILLLPLIGSRNGKWRYSPIGIFAVVAAILTTGSVALYDYSRGLSLHGVTEHVESLTACATTVGYFAFVCYLLDGMKREGKGNVAAIIGGTAAYGLYLLGVDVRPEGYAGIILCLWVIFPSFAGFKKRENNT